MENPSSEKHFEITPEILNNLDVTRKWTMFLSVLGFIFLGLLIAISLITSTFLTAFKTEEARIGIPESLMIIVLGVVAILYFFPVLFLFRFSRHTRNAVHSSDPEELKKAFRNLRSYFTYIGVMAIIVITVYVVAIVVAGASMSLLKGI